VRNVGSVECGDVVRKRRLKSSIVDWCGLQIVSKLSDLGGGVSQPGSESLGVLLVGRTRGHSLSQCLGSQPRSSKERGDAVMQIPTQPGTLLRKGLYGPPSRRLQLAIATQSVDQGGGFVG
jgi:hypothetical protein